MIAFLCFVVTCLAVYFGLMGLITLVALPWTVPDQRRRRTIQGHIWNK